MKKHNYEVGDILSDKEFEALKKTCVETRFDGSNYTLEKDLVFNSESIDNKNCWRLASSREQRIEDSDTGHPAIIKLVDNRHSKAYYDRKL